MKKSGPLLKQWQQKLNIKDSKCVSSANFKNKFLAAGFVLVTEQSKLLIIRLQSKSMYLFIPILLQP